MLDTHARAPRTTLWDISVLLSRTRIPVAVVQEGLCSVHAETVFAVRPAPPLQR
jgi:hypothetical protein